ncbi:MAG: GlsB/YeaQ/YmgE family stress response membrane protein [Acidobacteria bacterium]|nr:GlsB/YeaQ/YmgE family stress response membrane protein [Acidobacteriota bacterium]
MGILSWVVMGLLVGIVARILMPGRDRGGIVLTIVLGIGGAVLGGYIASRLGWGDFTGFNLKSFGLAVGGALILLLVYRLVRSR